MGHKRDPSASVICEVVTASVISEVDTASVISEVDIAVFMICARGVYHPKLYWAVFVCKFECHSM